MSALFAALVAGFVGTVAGWSLHAGWLSRRITIHSVPDHDGRVLEWLVNFGRPIVGRFEDYTEARHHAARIRNALAGRADGRRKRAER